MISLLHHPHSSLSQIDDLFGRVKFSALKDLDIGVSGADDLHTALCTCPALISLSVTVGSDEVRSISKSKRSLITRINLHEYGSSEITWSSVRRLDKFPNLKRFSFFPLRLPQEPALPFYSQLTEINCVSLRELVACGDALQNLQKVTLVVGDVDQRVQPLPLSEAKVCLPHLRHVNVVTFFKPFSAPPLLAHAASDISCLLAHSPMLRRIELEMMIRRLTPHGVERLAAWLDKLERHGVEELAVISYRLYGPGVSALSWRYRWLHLAAVITDDYVLMNGEQFQEGDWEIPGSGLWLARVM
jgi:hypothetical protein